MIQIAKASFDFEMQDEEFARELYGRWDTFSRNCFEDVLQRVLKRYQREGKLIRIESLELDLGTLDEEVFYEHFPLRLTEKLEEFFEGIFRGGIHNGSVQILPETRNLSDILFFYLKEGSFRWDTLPAHHNLQALWRDTLEYDRENTCKLLRLYGSDQRIRARLAMTLNDEQLGGAVGLCEPDHDAFIRPYLRLLLVSHRTLARPEISFSAYRHIVWEFTLAYLLGGARGFFSRKQLVVQTLSALAAHYNISFLHLLDILTQASQDCATGRSFVSEMAGILQQIRQQYFPQGSGQPQMKGTKEENETQAKAIVPAPVILTPDPEEIPPTNTTTTSDPLYIGNAGLVLLSPYLPRLMDMLTLTREKQFADQKARNKAILILQSICCDGEDFPENELILSKLLCGCELSTPVPLSLPLDAPERKTVEQMLRSVISNWKKIGSTSVRGFRESFLLRESKLEQFCDHSLLSVQQKGYDILLDSMPWSYQPVKYPWMPLPLRVAWR